MQLMLVIWLVFANFYFCFIPEPNKRVVDTRRTLFEPAVKVPRSESDKRELLYKELKDVLPDSCLVMMKAAEHTEEPVIYDQLEDESDYLFNLSEDQINDIEKITIGQSENEDWYKYRKGRITASNFYRVHTKVQTIRSSGDSGYMSTKNLLEYLQGSEVPESLPALQYGRHMEEVAKQVYFKHFQENHQNATIRDCGLFIHISKQYLGASPDALVECSCCGKGVLEIKCPFSIMYQTPLPENLSYLISQDRKVSLKQGHKYYAQIQGQMAITKRDWCHFYVFTHAGFHLETIKFDESYWNLLETNLSWFYNNYMSQK